MVFKLPHILHSIVSGMVSLSGYLTDLLWVESGGFEVNDSPHLGHANSAILYTIRQVSYVNIYENKNDMDTLLQFNK
ncbi:MAG: hypothetical protein AB7V56_15285 [Candidatus Nitrosocosmicus sp.]